VSRGLQQIREIGWLPAKSTQPVNHGPGQPAGKYTLTPFSDAAHECMQAVAEQIRTEIAVEKELRKRKRQNRIAMY
jgi:hypothetical protein